MEFSARVTSKGQLTLPAAVRKKLDIHQGDTVTIKLVGETAQLTRKTSSIASLQGIIPALPGVETADFDDLIDEAMSAHADEFMKRYREVPE